MQRSKLKQYYSNYKSMHFAQWGHYLGHHDFKRIQLLASSFPESTFEFFNKLLGLPVSGSTQMFSNEIPYMPTSNWKSWSTQWINYLVSEQDVQTTGLEWFTDWWHAAYVKSTGRKTQQAGGQLTTTTCIKQCQAHEKLRQLGYHVPFPETCLHT